MTSSLDSDWDVDRIKRELKKEKEAKLAIQHAIMELEQVQNEIQHNEDNGEENEWHKRYLEQAAINSQLAQQISHLEAQLLNAREAEGDDVSYSSYQDLDNTNVRQLLKKLERERTELEWQLKDCEWRLDQEAAAVYKAGEDRKMMMTQLGQASMVMGIEGGRQKPYKKHGTGSSLKQKSLTPSPQKEIKQTPEKDGTTDNNEVPVTDEIQGTEVQVSTENVNTSSDNTTSPVQD